jgi:hypothetical protein
MNLIYSTSASELACGWLAFLNLYPLQSPQCSSADIAANNAVQVSTRTPATEAGARSLITLVHRNDPAGAGSATPRAQVYFLATQAQCSALQSAGVGQCCGTDMCNAPPLSCALGVVGGAVATVTVGQAAQTIAAAAAAAAAPAIAVLPPSSGIL